MSWISKYLSADEIHKIEETVARVEEFTSGEIVPVIVKRSSSVGHVPLTLALMLTLGIALVELPFSDWLWVTPWVWLWPVLFVGIYYFSFVIAKIPWVQKALVPDRDEVNQVHQRAQLEFYANRINRTKAGTGVLIFVSVMEKKAVILADEGIAQKLPADTWDQVLKDFRGHLHQGEWASAFIKAIENCGEHLKTHFPITTPGHNELKNQLVVKD